MNNRNKPRNIIHEMANVLQLLGDDYTLTSVECNLGGSAARITKRNSEKTLCVIAYNDPEDTEICLYDEDNSLIPYQTFFDKSIDDSTSKEIADCIIKSL